MVDHEYFRNLSTDIAITAGELKQTKIFEEIVPEAYYEYKDVFTKNRSMNFPHIDHGTMQLNSFQEITRSTVKHTI